ncbi:chymotrypsin-like elastase family member 2A [Dermacentor silvarum]|uniref:chymotrypsin-like elastase family member 2A n=1 Tax=Dermacentor silvarum TaxID=543639 RepID=UPI0021013F6C|nr:chymotrypsin-like elastase family member 2A [Dermacentor silvarum]
MTMRTHTKLYFLVYVTSSILHYSCPAQAKNFPVNTKECGLSDPVGRVINGKYITKSQVPWVIFLSRVYHGYLRYCTGTIITNNVIATAAHCVESRGETILKMHVYYNTSIPKGGTCVTVERGIIHEKYVRPEHGYDIALIQLVKPIPGFSRFVRPVCLPRESSKTPARSLLVVGFGAIDFNHTDSKHLQYYVTKPLSDENCDVALKHRRIHATSDRVICGTSSHQRAWKGDSGGPLTAVSKSGKSTLYGMVSFGSRRRKAHAPTVHTRISAFVPWIRKSLRNIQSWKPVVAQLAANAKEDHSCTW